MNIFLKLQETIIENKSGIETSKSIDLEYTSVDIDEINTIKSEIYKYISEIKKSLPKTGTCAGFCAKNAII